MSEIDHEAAKVYAEYLGCCANNKLHNLAVAYLDLHEQIAAKDRRIAALVNLVEWSYMEGHRNQANSTNTYWGKSESQNTLARIMEDDQ